MADANNHQTIKCRVKWFDSKKGFGFLLHEDGGSDILLHANVLRAAGRSTLAEGVLIEVEIVEVNGRRQAQSIVAIHLGDGKTVPKLAQFAALDPEALQALPYLPARVKWYDQAKGIGFANVFGIADDVFLHAEVLRAAGIASLGDGEAVVLRTVQGERGCLAVEVADWSLCSS
jgi:CspA family cold shock protein